MKRFLSIFLSLCLLGLCGCGAQAPVPPEKEPPESLMSDNQAQEPAADTSVPSEAPELAPILTEIRERMHPGTAGSSLTALELGAALLDWSVTTGVNEEQIRASVEEFLAPMNSLERAEFAVQTAAVSGAVKRLLSDEAAAMMEDIGGTESTLYPWENAQTGLLDALFDAAGAYGELIDPNE